MHYPEREEGSQSIIEHLSVRPVELRDRRQDESHRHVLKEVDMAAGVDRERVRGVAGGIFEAVTDVFVILDTLVYDAVGEDEEVGGKGEGPGAGDGCFMKLVNVSSCSGEVQGSRSIFGTGTPTTNEVLMIAMRRNSDGLK